MNLAEANIAIFIFNRFAKGDSFGKISDMLAHMDIASPQKMRLGTVKRSQNSWQMKNIWMML